MLTRDALLECLPPVAYNRAAPRVRAEATAAAAVLDGAISLADVLALEQQPDSAALAMPDWERNYGLPDDCITTLLALAPGSYPYALADLASFSRAGMATYVDAADGLVKTAAANIPRFQGGELLIEPASTNLLLYSDQFDNAAWNKVTCTVTPNAALAPDGTMTADRLTATGADSIVLQNVAYGAAVPFSFPVWLRSDVPLALNILVRQLPSNTDVYSTGLALTTAWRRFWVSGVTVAGTTSLNLHIGSGGSFTTGEVIYAWRAQLEAAALPSSDIFTAGAAASRAADVCSVVVPPSEAQRRANLLGRLQRNGNLSRAFMIAQAEALGYPGATITEHGPITCEDPCDSPCNGEEFIHVWSLNLAASTAIEYATCESPCDSPLAKWGNTQLECVINRRKPAHTVALFAYAP